MTKYSKQMTVTIDNSSPIRNFISGIGDWGQAQSSINFLDFVMVWGIYQLVGSSNRAILLLCILSTLKATNIVWIYLASGYTKEYSDNLCSIIAIGLEISFFIYDQIGTFATVYRTLPLFSTEQTLKILIKLMTALFMIIGLFFRVMRSYCRFTVCYNQGRLWDIYIIITIIVSELILIGIIIQQCMKFKNHSQVSHIFNSIVMDAKQRLYFLIPFGMMEILSYYIQGTDGGGLPIFVGWFAQIGLYARSYYPTLFAISIMGVKENVRNAGGSGGSGYKTRRQIESS
ncbi:hypothetical protein BC833DRAFT_585966 [Globomyces pollinis-pini]|nr:hypothetical protein BC833DRAFT_585966 [Globomyces pollinis-pini]KAJ2998421.1 hypothetical protein HDV02_004536 [Globomyces sp. JEL0801]